MKILYYNWVDYLDPENRGGGITIYQRNLMKSWKDRDDVEAWFLSSGISFDIFNTSPRWDKCRHGTSDAPRRYEIVNSAVLSPSHMSFGNPSQLSHENTKEAFFNFLRTHGPFDVIHFNSLEGIPAEVLNLKTEWPETRVILSLHNYYPFCPQVNLWRQERTHCDDFDEGHNCRSCLLHRPDERIVRLAGSVAYRMKMHGMGPGTFPFDKGFTHAMRAARHLIRLKRKSEKASSIEEIYPESKNRLVQISPEAERPISPYPAKEFRARRERMLELINRNCDHVLGVSERVSKIARDYGVNPKLVSTVYIGTRQSEKFNETTPRPSLVDKRGLLTLGFLGYMREDKGYFFLIRALKQLPKDLAGRVRLVLAAPRRGDTKELHELSAHLREVVYSDGYSHDQLDALLADVTLGVIPVLWEDNLPQVAIEMHARHIPLLTSNRGGAQELGNYQKLVFEAGNVKDFVRRIQDALDGKIDLDSYWKGARPPVGTDDHLDTLLNYYRKPLVKQKTTPLEYRKVSL